VVSSLRLAAVALRQERANLTIWYFGHACPRSINRRWTPVAGVLWHV